MKDMKMLLDGYAESGNDYSDFKEKVDEVVDMTKDLVVRGRDITFLSLCEKPDPSLVEPGKELFYVLDEKSLESFVMESKRLAAGRVTVAEIGYELFDELKKTTGLMAIINGEKYLFSDNAIKTFTIRASVSGEYTVTRQNLIRNMHIADAIIAKNEKIHFVYREIQIGTRPDGTPVMAKKIFACLGGYYQPVPQSILYNLADLVTKDGTLGDMSVNYWTLNQRFTDLYIDFPTAADDFKKLYKLPDKIIPGLLLCTSDTGDSSVIVRGVYRVGRHYVITDEVAMKHTKEVSARKILDRADEVIFSSFRRLPETLANLIGKEVADYSSIDLSSESGAAKNLSAVAKCMESLSKKLLKSILPKKHLDTILQCMQDEIDSSRPYTLYDIAITFMGIADRLSGLDNVTLTEIRKACARAPFILDKEIKVYSAEEEEIALLPA